MSSSELQPPPAATPSFRQHLEAGLFALAFSALLFSPTWGKVLFYRDLFLWSYPGIHFFQESLRAGELPLWSPHFFLGYPFLAEMAYAILYPLSLIQLLFAVPLAMKLYPAVHYLLTGYLMWRLLREWRLNQAAALFGALTWMASGYLVSMSLNFNYLAPACWYPGVLWCGHRLLQTRGRRWFLATGLVWALVLLSGDPQAFLLSGVLLVLYAGLGGQTFLSVRTSGARTALPLLALAGALTSLLVMAQFLPSLEFGAWCTKVRGFEFEHATQWSFHPLRLLEFIWPEMWGPIYPPENFWGPFLGARSSIPWAGVIYLGQLPLLLALAACRRYRERPIGFLVLVLVLSFLLALGYYSPFYRLVWELVAPYRIFRYPEKHLSLVTFALAGLAAFGFQRLLAPEQEAARRCFLRTWIPLTALLTAAFLVLFLGLGPLAQFLSDYLRRTYQYPTSTYFIRASLPHALGRAPLVAGAYLIVWLLSLKVAPLRRRLGPILILITALDLLGVDRGQIIVTDPSLFSSESAAVRILRRAQAGAREQFRIFRSTKILIPLHLTQPAGLSPAERKIFWNRDTLLSNIEVLDGLQNIYGYDPAELNYLRRFSSHTPSIEIFQMLNLKYLLDGLAQGEFSPMPGLSVVGEDPEINLRVWLNRDCFSRAYFVDGVLPAQDEWQFLDSLYVANLRRQVILLQPSAPASAGSRLIPARITSYQNREVVIEITNPVTGHLVLSDTYFPGWTAAVDGRPVRILRANYLVRAVPLEPGSHQVIFTYRPWPWRIGATASMVSLLLVAVALLLGRRHSCLRWQVSSKEPSNPDT